MIRRIGALVAVVIAASALVAPPAVAQDADASDAPATTVRIQARKVESGKVEFGLQLDGDSEWLPRARLFPYPTAEVGRWLFSSPYTMSDGTTVRIQARLLANGKLEFGLQLNDNQAWLPRARLFPYATTQVGRWLLSSAYTTGDPATATTPATNGSGKPPSTPRNLKVAAVVCDLGANPHSIRLSWDPPSSTGSSTITGYAVSRLRVPQPDRDDHPGGFVDWVSSWVRAAPSIADPGVDRTVTGQSFIDDQVFLSELYEWSVRAISDAGQSPPAKVRASYLTDYSHYRPGSATVFRTHCDDWTEPLPAASPPGAPRNLTAEWRNDGPFGEGIYLTWSPPSDDGGDRITSYFVFGPYLASSRAQFNRYYSVERGLQEAYVGISGHDWTWHYPDNWSGDPTEVEWVLTTEDVWEPGRTYLFGVEAINSHGQGEPATVSVVADGPGKPRNLRIRMLCNSRGSPRQMRVHWQAPASDRGSAISGYAVDVLAEPEGLGSGGTVSTTTWELWEVTESWKSWIPEAEELLLTVRARNANGLSGRAALRVDLDSLACS